MSVCVIGRLRACLFVWQIALTSEKTANLPEPPFKVDHK